MSVVLSHTIHTSKELIQHWKQAGGERERHGKWGRESERERKRDGIEKKMKSGEGRERGIEREGKKEQA